MSVYFTLENGVHTFPHTCQIIYAMYFQLLHIKHKILFPWTGSRFWKEQILWNGMVKGAQATWATGWFSFCVITTLCLTSGTPLPEFALIDWPTHSQLSITTALFVWWIETVRAFFTSPRDSVNHHRASSTNLLLPSEYPVSTIVEGRLSERPAGRSFVSLCGHFD